MNVQIIYDEISKEAHLYNGHGFSAMLGNYLFDTGDKGGPLIENLRRLQYSVYDIKAVIISHDHYDHWGGLWDLLKLRGGLTVYAGEHTGKIFQKKVIETGGKLVPVSQLMKLDPELYITREITGEYKGKPMPEISAVIKTGNGVSLCTGCAHPGIKTIAAEAVKEFPEVKRNYVFGGFHLHSETEESIDAAFSDLRKLGFRTILPGHCSGEYAKSKGDLQMYSGLKLNL